MFYLNQLKECRKLVDKYQIQNSMLNSLLPTFGTKVLREVLLDELINKPYAGILCRTGLWHYEAELINIADMGLIDISEPKFVSLREKGHEMICLKTYETLFSSSLYSYYTIRMNLYVIIMATISSIVGLIGMLA